MARREPFVVYKPSPEERMYELLDRLGLTHGDACKVHHGQLKGWSENDSTIPVEFDDSSGWREILIADGERVVRFRINGPRSAECISIVPGFLGPTTEDLYGEGKIYLNYLIEGGGRVDLLEMMRHYFVPDRE